MYCKIFYVRLDITTFVLSSTDPHMPPFLPTPPSILSLCSFGNTPYLYEEQTNPNTTTKVPTHGYSFEKFNIWNLYIINKIQLKWSHFDVLLFYSTICHPVFGKRSGQNVHYFDRIFSHSTNKPKTKIDRR